MLMRCKLYKNLVCMIYIGVLLKKAFQYFCKQRKPLAKQVEEKRLMPLSKKTSHVRIKAGLNNRNETTKEDV